MYYILGYDGVNRIMSIVDEDTLLKRDTNLDEFIELCSNGLVGGSFSNELRISGNYTIQDLPNLYKSRGVGLSSGDISVDVVVDDTMLLFTLSYMLNSWRANRMRYFKNGVLAYGDGEHTYIWYEGILFTVSDIYQIYGMYFNEDNELCIMYESLNGGCDYIYLSKDTQPKQSRLRLEECSLSVVKRKVLIG